MMDDLTHSMGGVAGLRQIDTRSRQLVDEVVLMKNDVNEYVLHHLRHLEPLYDRYQSLSNRVVAVIQSYSRVQSKIARLCAYMQLPKGTNKSQSPFGCTGAFSC